MHIFIVLANSDKHIPGTSQTSRTVQYLITTEIFLLDWTNLSQSHKLAWVLFMVVLEFLSYILWQTIREVFPAFYDYFNKFFCISSKK